MNLKAIKAFDELMSQLNADQKAYVYQVASQVGQYLEPGSFLFLFDKKHLGDCLEEEISDSLEEKRELASLETSNEAPCEMVFWLQTPRYRIILDGKGNDFFEVLSKLQANMTQIIQKLPVNQLHPENWSRDLLNTPARFMLH